MKKENGILTEVTDKDLELLKNNPEKFWKGVTQIDTYAFDDCTSLQEITIPEGVTEICKSGFYYCQNLKEVVLPKSLKRIGYCAFAGCRSIKSIEIPEGVEEIETSAFSYCQNLKEVVLPKSLKRIGDTAFTETAVEKIEIPEGVEEIDKYTFEKCKKLKEVVLPKSLKRIGGSAFREAAIEKIEIPEGVEEIEPNAFYYCQNLKEVILPKSLKRIGDNAFRKTAIERIEIPEGIKKIDVNTFSYCQNLKEVALPKSLKRIIYCAFAGCRSIKSIEIPEGVEYICQSSFEGLDYFVVNTVNGKKCSCSSTLFDIFEFKEIKDMISNGTDFGGYNTLVKKLGGKEALGEGAKELLKLGKVLGLFEPESVTTMINGKQVPVKNVAYTLLQDILITNKALDSKNLHRKLSRLKNGNFCEAFLKFISNKTNCANLLNDLESFPQIVSWFRARQKLSTLNQDVQEPGDEPTIEENRYKVYRYSLGENGTYKNRWNAPTVQFIKDELAEKKYKGVKQDKKHIAKALSAISAYKEQRVFDKASKTGDERRELVEQ